LLAVPGHRQPTEEQTVDTITFRKFEGCDQGKVLYHAFDTDLGHMWAPKFDDYVLNFFLSL